MGRHLGARIDGSAVKADTGTTGGAVGGDGSRVRSERVCWVLGGDTALEGSSLDVDAVLCEAKFIE